MADRRPVRVGVGVFVFRDRRFVMGRRRGAHGAGSWSLPGGHLEFGESFEEAARREVDEEVGLALREVEVAAVTNDLFPDEGRHYVTVWLSADHAGGTACIREPGKCSELGWFGFDELPSPLFRPWRQLLASPFLAAIRRRAG